MKLLSFGINNQHITKIIDFHYCQKLHNFLVEKFISLS